MKQKNLAMLGVAVGCGLVAAIAVAKLSAGGNSGPEMVKVLVAKKDIPLNTKLDEKELDQWVMWADMPKALIPPEVVSDPEAVKNKEVNRTLKTGNPITHGDLGIPAGIVLPEGFKQITFKATQIDAVAGFARPGSKVDVMYIERTVSGKFRAAIVLKDMLVLAVNAVDQLKEGVGRAITEVNSVSLAVTDKQALLVGLLESKGTLKLVLRGNTSNDKKEPNRTEPNAKDIVFQEDPFSKDDVTTAPAVDPGPALASVVTAKKSVPMNTLINADNVSEYFDLAEVRRVPEGGVTRVDDLKGLYITKNLEPGQFVLKAVTGKDAIKIDVDPPVVPDVKPDMTPRVDVKPEVVVKKLPRFEQTIQEAGQTKRVIWVEVQAGKWKRFESEKEADAYKPSETAEDKKSDDATKTPAAAQ